MLQSVITRLESKATLLAAVLPLENLAALDKGVAPRSGAAFVLPYREKAEPNDLGMGGFFQVVHVQFLVALIVRQHDDASGGKKIITLDSGKAEIEAALAGWQPSEQNNPCELVAGQATPLGNGVTAYVMTWQSSRYLEAVE
ncbi:hypothetical protein A6U97_12030 [Agrobacterium tumefaciens]|uniref:phage tail terminator protein n=1 Tax=Agrobacterium tumefaciens TaxID=358 RepID=UPI00080F787F|nr:hypothetical protein A6U97_12030 [Agrobacterium tumefaciens]